MTTNSTSVDLTEVLEWLSENWDPDLTVATWWDRLGRSGWAAPSLPAECYGKGLSPAEAVQVHEAIADYGALPSPGGLGLQLAAPTIAVHGTAEQKDRYIQAIVCGQEAWCQLFSEPGAGSDLASLQTRAIRDGDEWVITGQKVWTSVGQIADLGMLLARTDPDVPKHQGITYFAFDMKQSGVEVRPLREMTGRAVFNEVFINEARVSNDAIIGGVNNGWAVENTTLAFERTGQGGGASGRPSTTRPGSLAGDLAKRAGDLVPSQAHGGSERPGILGRSAQVLMTAAREMGLNTDLCIRQDLARLHILTEIGRYMTLREKAVRAAGGDIPGMANIGKLSMNVVHRLSRDLGMRILGPRGMLHSYDDADTDEALLNLAPGRLGGLITEMVLLAQGPQIYGGTDQIQRNIVSERVLGLPKEPNPDKFTPFKDLPRN